MSLIFKVAYARGVQHALVNTGAIHKYANEHEADKAAEMAAAEMSDSIDPLEHDVPAEETADVATKLVELSNAAEETAAAAQEQSDVAAEAASAVAAIKESGDLSIATGGGAQSSNTILSAAGVTAEGAMEAANRPPEYAASMPAPQEDAAQLGVQVAHPGAPTAIDVTKAAGVNIDGNTAAAILRKLAAGSDFSHTTGTSGPNHVSDSETAEGKMEASNRPEAEANQAPAVSEPAAQLGIEQAHPEGPGDAAAPLEGKVASAFDILFNKTTSEVAPYLPETMSEQNKVAAVRTMIGMTGPERADYILRIKAAEEGYGSEKKEKKKEEHSEDKKEEKKEEEAKEAAMILRRLGFGA